MPTKELLTEENYERTSSKLKKISLIIFIASLVIGLGLIILGFVKQSDIKRQNQELHDAAYAESQAQYEADNARLSEIAQELSDLNSKYNAKNTECASLNMGDPDWFAQSTTCSTEAMTIQTDIAKLEQEQFQLNHANHTVHYNPIPNMTYIIFYILGGSIIFMGGIVSLIIWLITKRRAIAAYSVQTARPLVEEGVDKAMPTVKKVTKGIAEARAEAMNTVAPSLGKTAEEISKGITKGIKEGKE